jgi:hypothetical protein
MMSLLKFVPEGLKPQECKRTKLRESLLVPYKPRKDEVQEEVSRLRNLELKTRNQEGHHSELSGVARKRDAGSLSYARDGGTRCNQET